MSFFAELKRRNVFRVGIAYGITAWLLMQVADILFEAIGTPPWAMQTLLVFLGLGFFVALFFAWAFELTPEGVKREKEVDRTQSITPQTGKKLNNTILVLMALAIAYLLFDKFSAPVQPGSDPFTQALDQTDGIQEKRALTPAEAKPAVSRQSIAVLPFANRSNKEDDLFFTDGIHDDLLTQLAKITDLKVISRTSVMKYKDTQKTIPEIAIELGVATILEGGIQRAGDRIRINAQLIDVDTDEHLWAETFDREMTIENIFDIQSEITRQIVTAVRGELSDEESEALANMPTDSLAAYEAYLHAKTVLNSPDYNEEKYQQAGIWAGKAVENDPEFAQAWAMLVGIHGQAIWLGFDRSPERHQRVQDALNNASRYGPFLPETLAARGEYLYRVESNFHEAEVALRAASKAKPGDADLMLKLAFTLRRTAQWEQAVNSFQLAIELDPDNIHARSALAETLILMQEYDRAEPLVNAWIEKYPQAMDIKSYKTQILMLGKGDLEAARNWHDQVQPNSGTAYFQSASSLPWYERDYQAAIDIWDLPEITTRSNRANSSWQLFMLATRSQAYMLVNDRKKAIELAQQAIETALKIEPGSNTNYAFSQSALSTAYLLTGQIGKALETIEMAAEVYPESRDSLNGVFISSIRAEVMAKAGHRDQALAEIERLLNTPAGMNHWNLFLDPRWDFFRDDERFNELVRPLNLEEGGL